MAYQKLQGYRALSVVPSDTINIPNPAAIAQTGVTTSAAADKLISSTGNFIVKGVAVGDIVYDTTNSVVATVTSVDSATELGTTVAIVTGATYVIYSQLNNSSDGCVLYVGTSGNLKVTTAAGDDVVFTNLPVGFFPVQVLKVWATGTAAAGIIALW
jgi:hypothetical protein